MELKFVSQLKKVIQQVYVRQRAMGRKLVGVTLRDSTTDKWLQNGILVDIAERMLGLK